MHINCQSIITAYGLLLIEPNYCVWYKYHYSNNYYEYHTYRNNLNGIHQKSLDVSNSMTWGFVPHPNSWLRLSLVKDMLFTDTFVSTKFLWPTASQQHPPWRRLTWSLYCSVWRLSSSTCRMASFSLFSVRRTCLEAPCLSLEMG